MPSSRRPTTPSSPRPFLLYLINPNPMKHLLLCLAVLVVSTVSASAQSPVEYDIVISGGRVIDPETDLDSVRNIGIVGRRIAQITTEALKGKVVIDARGLVVSPGFIDLHVHGRTNQEQEYQLHDGLTTTLELEWGIENMKEWHASRQGKALINYGASVCWPYERFKSFDQYQGEVEKLRGMSRRGESSLEGLANTISRSYAHVLSPQQSSTTLANIEKSLQEGAIGIGVPIGYLKNTNPAEMYSVFQLASRLQTTIFSHVREPNVVAVQEVMADAILTGASLHIVHINSMTLGNVQVALDMVNAAQAKGFDITTEVYPYTAASTLLQSAVFDDGWQQKLGISYGDLQWVQTGERLTEATFNSYRKSGGAAIIHMMKPEWIKTAIINPKTIIASDGMAYSPLAHPRTAGTYARVLGRYVREEKALDLMTAIRKMTLLPAQRLERIAPSMRYKGRIQVGADADITVFNASTIIDQATFEKGLAFSKGIEYVLVNGMLVLKSGKTIPGVFAGQPVFGKEKR